MHFFSHRRIILKKSLHRKFKFFPHQISNQHIRSFDYKKFLRNTHVRRRAYISHGNIIRATALPGATTATSATILTAKSKLFHPLDRLIQPRRIRIQNKTNRRITCGSSDNRISKSSFLFIQIISIEILIRIHKKSSNLGQKLVQPTIGNRAPTYINNIKPLALHAKPKSIFAIITSRQFTPRRQKPVIPKSHIHPVAIAILSIRKSQNSILRKLFALQSVDQSLPLIFELHRIINMLRIATSTLPIIRTSWFCHIFINYLRPQAETGQASKNKPLKSRRIIGSN
ncbi:MAG TPA: hypothetical protein PK398_00640 [Candidatus Gracilibacteria bacterium]|nr:hypothetical protein [Candidatus Gracilibacteria bacterium]